MDAKIEQHMKIMTRGFEIGSAIRAINSETKKFEQLNGIKSVVNSRKSLCMIHPPRSL